MTVYYGAQTERACENFAVSGQTLGGQTSLLTAIAQVKKAAALANLDIGVLREPVAMAICQAADEITDARRSATLLDDMVAQQQALATETVRNLTPAARQAIYYAAAAVARADEEISHQEELALEVVAEALHLDAVPAAMPDGLSPQERELTYACAAWLAGADSVTAGAETELLARLRGSLDISEPTAARLQADIDALRAARRRYLPRSEQLPWWEEFGELVPRLLHPAGIPQP